jgi:arylsulfate sulfotransferase
MYASARYVRSSCRLQHARLLLVAIVQLLLVACGGGASKPILRLTPSLATLHCGNSQKFALPQNSTSAPVLWTVNGIPGGNSQVGTITAAGVYHSPVIPPTPNEVTISAENQTLIANANVIVGNPAPQIKSIAPGLVVEGSAFTLQITGSGFVRESVVQVGGAPLPTTLISATEVKAEVQPSVIAAAGSLDVLVVNPAPGGGTTKPVALTVLATGTVSPTINPQVANYSFVVPHDATVAVEFGPSTSYGLRTWALPTPSGGGRVDILVAGMRASTLYHMRARITLSDGTVLLDNDHTFTTGGLAPDRVPQLTVTHGAGTPTPGIELINMLQPDGNQEQMVATDLDGNVIWYYQLAPGQGAAPLRLLPNGHFQMYITQGLDHSKDVMREIDLAGNSIRELKLADLNRSLAARGYSLMLEAMHHELLALPNGHVVMLTNLTKQLSGIGGNPGTTAVQGDVLVDVDANFNPVWVWSSFDHLDPNRHLQGLPDWTHSNALVYSAADGNLLLSLRHQSWIIKIDYANGTGSGDILWRLGDEGDFSIAGGDVSQWFYAEHNPQIVSVNGSKFTLSVMDNGNLRIPSGGGEGCGFSVCYSRAAIFEVDETSRTARLLWDYLPGFYSYWGGSVSVLPTGNVEAAFSQSVLANVHKSRIVEVTGGPSPQVVWQMDVAGEAAYRSFRTPSLYPGVAW